MSIQNNTHDAHASQEELNMKKYLALLLAAIMALSLAACASTAKTEDAASTSGKLTMATEATFPPYEYYDGARNFRTLATSWRLHVSIH